MAVGDVMSQLSFGLPADTGGIVFMSQLIMGAGIIAAAVFFFYWYYKIHNIKLEIWFKSGSGWDTKFDRARNGVMNNAIGIREFKAAMTKISIPSIPVESIYKGRVFLEKFGNDDIDYRPINIISHSAAQFRPLEQDLKAYGILKLREIDAKYSDKNNVMMWAAPIGIVFMFLTAIVVIIWMSQDLKTYASATTQVISETRPLLQAILQQNAQAPPVG